MVKKVEWREPSDMERCDYPVLNVDMEGSRVAEVEVSSSTFTSMFSGLFGDVECLADPSVVVVMLYTDYAEKKSIAINFHIVTGKHR